MKWMTPLDAAHCLLNKQLGHHRVPMCEILHSCWRCEDTQDVFRSPVAHSLRQRKMECSAKNLMCMFMPGKGKESDKMLFTVSLLNTFLSLTGKCPVFCLPSDLYTSASPCLYFLHGGCPAQYFFSQGRLCCDISENSSVTGFRKRLTSSELLPYKPWGKFLT